MAPLKFLTWNIRGVGSQVKKNKILNHLTYLQSDICLLQETHLTKAENNKLLTSQFSHVFSSYYNTKQRGVSILINKKISFIHNSTISDPEGRFVIINITINNNPMTIASIYGPNSDSPSFFHSFFSNISRISDGPIIIGGDFNTVIDPSMDRSTCSTRLSQSTEIIKQYMEDLGLGDGWRLQNPTSREYSFFSSVHKSYSRIDFFLLSNSIQSKLSNLTIHPIIISDHAPVTFNWNQIHPDRINTPIRWRFNTSLLKDQEFNSLIQREWASFLEINDSPKSSPSVLWEAGKAVLRGIIISYSTYKKKNEKQQQSELERKIKQLEIINANNPTKQTENELRQYKLEINDIINKKTTFMIQRLRQEAFQHCNKSSKYLANQLKQNQEKTHIVSIQNSAGKPTQSPVEINQIFKDFYAKLYSSENDPLQTDINRFLNNINLPKLTQKQQLMLDSPITDIELEKALKLMPNNKSPGPDGFPAEFYKHFWSILTPLFQRVVTEITKTSRLPNHMNSAIISLLLKPNKDPTIPSSYRPISLINVDLKLITKTLSHRLEKVIPSIIHPDQTGFIKGRHSSNNTRRLFNLLEYSTSQKQPPTIIVSLDAEKAFDKVNWSFLTSTLQTFGFGESFINWIHILHSSPTATVLTNGLTSQPFTLQRGTRQGCPLSPLLFTVFIEPLAAAIRQNPVISGIKTPLAHHKISLYADDILLYLQQPYTSLTETISLIKTYSHISDYSINLHKSVILPVRGGDWNVAAHTPPIPICTNYITYLGINISARLSELVNLNLTPLLKTITDSLNRWKNLPLSLIGRIAAIKMSILPKITYILSMIPIIPCQSWFKSLDSTITSFYWKNKTPRIKLSTLQKPKSQGGLNAPNFFHYSLAINLQYIYKWTHPTPSDSTWQEIEETFCQNIPLSALPFCSISIKQHPCFKISTISSTLTAWWKLYKITNATLSPSTLTPIWNNLDLLMNKKPLHFRTWAEKGITQLEHIFQNNTLVPFADLVQKFGIRSTQYLEYLQLQSSIMSSYKTRNINLELPPVPSELLRIESRKKLTAKIYQIITKSDTTISIPHHKWEQDLQLSPDAGFWTKICNNIYTMSKNANLQLIQYKIIHRTHFTRQKLSKFTSISDTCINCTQNTTDNYIHAIWFCSPVFLFWKQVTESLSALLDCHIPLSPSLCLLGDTSATTLNPSYIQLLLSALTIAKKTILNNWKSKTSINILQWKRQLSDHILTAPPDFMTIHPLSFQTTLIHFLQN